jgi:hypothetical protein
MSGIQSIRERGIVARQSNRGLNAACKEEKTRKVFSGMRSTALQLGKAGGEFLSPPYQKWCLSHLTWARRRPALYKASVWMF